MKMLLDMNLPRSLGELLVAAGHECRHVGDIGMASADDAEIVAEAKRADEVILTHDLDCGHLLAFSGERSPSVVIFRVRDARARHLSERLLDALGDIEPHLLGRTIAVLEDAATRVRELPIRQ